MPQDSIRVLVHSAIRLGGAKTVYIDPFHLEQAPKDGDLILITHEHYDHLSEEDIRRAAKDNAFIVVPKSCRAAALAAGLPEKQLLYLAPGEEALVSGIPIEAVAAYNVNKAFHPKEKGWLGYVVTVGGERIYIAGDTDDNEDVRRVVCDVAVLPVGGTYTMTADEAAALALALKPKLAVPSHYGDIVGTADDAARFAALLAGKVACSLAR